MKVKNRTALLALLLIGAAVAMVPTFAGADETARPTQREWMRANGDKPGRWVSRAGAGHLLTHRYCVKIQDPAFPNDPTKKVCQTDANGFPVEDEAKWANPNYAGNQAANEANPNGVDCQGACHLAPWEELRTKVVKGTGFTNIFGDTAEIEGLLLSPGQLLTDPENQTKHAVNFRKNGCGTCHSPAAAVNPAGGVTDIDPTWGKPGIVGCVSCHQYQFEEDPANDLPGNLHATHATLVGAEAPVADGDDPGAKSCDFCHAKGALKGSPGDASCYNCHLSGHWPKVPYWKATPKALEEVALPAPPASRLR